MTLEETIKILSIIKAAYPQWAKDLKASDAKMMVTLWNDMLQDYEYNLVQVAIKKVIATNKFPPSVAEVIESINYITSGGKSEMTEIEAWGLVRKAIKNSAYNAEEEFNKLPEKIQQAIGSHNILHNWSQETVDGIEKVIGSNFMRSYKATVIRKKEEKQLPSSIRKMLSNVGQKMIEEVK
ncbi:loader and inhibitor of phage G40P family protein [Clostridium sporogenes]|uniref:Loader and inhibitor of phage G40P family protein n=1 Tax=Clostridium sporogenes TaxID=1509 RepID=A0A1L3NKG6_CLOSG|nr:replicative helicase loader/inhibitor [Clostridium sporogenes]APH16656.1 loader and inhibitor of phage G40P family protein [Clostridium sporogenes]